ncbi:MAG: 16S rRNA (cytosine(1402)-N(4))-methyltransferase, partial [Coprobacillus sp.]|nr:16S rRNA (cytosine(1402)-N(4))-methyltransferase [Coprobacillus sp.]
AFTKCLGLTFQLCARLIITAQGRMPRGHWQLLSGHPAKRTFQALRIAVNDELNVFDTALSDALEILNVNGRIAVITFHSLEDKICKYTFNEVTKEPDLPRGIPIIPKEMRPKFKKITRKPIIASEDELKINHRSHSAKLRIIERVYENEDR